MSTSTLTQVTDRKKLVIKLGGSMLEELTNIFFKKIKAWQKQYDITIVHGGGPAINEALQRANIATEKIGGLRVTPREAMDVVQSTLIAHVNPSLVQRFQKNRLQAVGLNGFDGQLMQALPIDPNVYGEVGNVTTVNATLLQTLMTNGIIPVVASIAEDSVRGVSLNVNADEAARSVAEALRADRLMLVTDVPGILIDGKTCEQTTPDEIERWIETGDIYGGMIPKVDAAVNCLDDGIVYIDIVNETLEGTTITKKEENGHESFISKLWETTD